MVFDEIYCIYEQQILASFEEKMTEDEIEELICSGMIHDKILKRLAKALSVVIYRNGKIEDVHSGKCEGADDFYGIPDSCMKEINIDVCNKMYTMLKLLLSSDEGDFKMAFANILNGELCASGWNEPENDDSLCGDELLKLLESAESDAL
mgnify:FL=1